MADNLVPFADGTKDLRPYGDATMTKGSMIISPKQSCIAIEARVTANVLNSDSSTVAALAMADRLTLLSAYTLYVKRFLSEKDTIQPYQGQALPVVRDDFRTQQELDFVGLTGNTAGTLGGSFAVGMNKVDFTVLIPMGHLAFIKDSEKFTGICAEQLLDFEVKLKMGADPFKAANVKLALSSQTVTYVPRTRKARSRRHGVVFHSADINNPQSDTITTESGLVLNIWNKGALAGTNLETLRVTVKTDEGAVIVTDEPNTPAEVFKKYDLEPGSDSIEDSGHTDARTPLFLNEEKPLKNMFAGPVAVKQVKKKEDFDGIVNYCPTPSTAQVLAEVAQMAAKLPKNRQLLAVNTAILEKMDVEDAHLPFCGFTGLTDQDVPFYDYAGLRCLPGGVPFVVIPPQKLRNAALRILDAMKKSPEYPEGNTGAAESIRQQLAREIPGAIVDVVDGFTVPSWVYSQVQSMLAAEVNALVAAMQARRAA
ncbi:MULTISPECIES: hypothetical protein [unclassified Corallococcus]|uniref:hypothetical protein n=1 Tax=unclassified Corallococcus TaxID=2685029 RepID=UPI001A8DA708|nr:MULTISPECIES: hypothetical protein [unclassified Corallococcus]MBN9685390.1 hypothetical protein [Corallococcus sp. NCSPR001]WAS83159.1 hypothetical protein O0N60_28040 [Corallococcus sp. NCRR]